MKINFKIGYVTPFDPRTEIRLSEFGFFKQQVHDMLYFDKKSEEEVMSFIYRSRDSFVKKREFSSIEDLVESVKKTQPKF